jgi:CBS domain-containing protein
MPISGEDAQAKSHTCPVNISATPYPHPPKGAHQEKSMLVQEILALKGAVLYTISPDKTLAEAVATMSEQDVGSLVCFSKGQMVGMLTFREVLKAISTAGSQWQTLPVSEIMITEPYVGRPDMDVFALRQYMVDKHMRYLPVMEDNTLMGVISFHDVAKAMIEEQNFENRMLKAYIRDWPDAGTDSAPRE